MEKPKTIIVTGGAGFIGSALVRHLIQNTNHQVINVDKLTYAGNLESVVQVADSDRYHFEQVDICDLAELRRIFHSYEPDALMHLAAESHVDRSIDGPKEFIDTNILGTYNLLEAAREYTNRKKEKRKKKKEKGPSPDPHIPVLHRDFSHPASTSVPPVRGGDYPPCPPVRGEIELSLRGGTAKRDDEAIPSKEDDTSSPLIKGLPAARRGARGMLKETRNQDSGNRGQVTELREQNSEARNEFRFLHVSTDEVYGSLGKEGYFNETSAYKPNSPYSASKASSDHLVRAWYHTFGLPTVITNCSNNYGPYQFPEKLIPVVILNALEGKPIPVYGKGENIRDWLFVEDHVKALLTVLEKGQLGETYVIGGHNERTNLQVVECICSLMDELSPQLKVESHKSLITYVQDRPGHDLRYAIDPSKIQKDLSWKPKVTFEEGIRLTVQWYLDNMEWCRRILSGDYRLERLGLGGR